MLTSLRKTRYYRLFLWSVVIVCFLTLIPLAISVTTKPGWLEANDYVGYWSAGYLNLHGGNPYDRIQLLSLQQSTGKQDENVVMMWAPPWVLTLMSPFSMLEFSYSYGVWTLVNLLLIFLGVKITWDFYNGPKPSVWMGWIIAFTFIPVLDCLNKGQLGILPFFGAAGFLYFLFVKENDWFAGIILALLTIKPHTLYLFALAAIIWAIYRGHWKILLGSFLAIGGGTFVSWSINPKVFDQYFFAIQNYPPSDWATPTIGGVLRLLTGTDTFLLQFLPTIAGILWYFLLHWPKHRKTWDWGNQAPLLILISFFSAAYGWSFDQPAALIAILQITVLTIHDKGLNSSILLIVAGYVLIIVFHILTRGNDFFLFWFAPAVLAWYLVSRYKMRRRLRSEQPVILETEIVTTE